MRFDVLSRHLNVFAPHFLEASAGTGKTFAIEHLVTRLLIEGNHPFSIEQVLVVTFTRAAARELKLRVRRNLTRVKEDLISSSTSLDYLQAILERGPAATKSAIEKIEAALICYESAQIFTLHGFCHRILKEFAFEAGIGLEVADPEEKEHLALVEQAIKEHLKESVALPKYSPTQVKLVLNKKYQRDARKMISSLVNIVANSQEISCSPSFEELFASFHQVLHTIDIDPALFKADLAQCIPHYKKLTSEDIQKQIALLCEVLSAKGCTQEQFDAILKAEFFLEKMGSNNLKARAKLPENRTLHYPGLIERLRAELLPVIQIAKDPAQIFLRLAHDLQQSVQHLLERKGKFSPDALLLKVEQALQIPQFVECVQQKYRGAIIDEFQDTDPIQWNIFQRLFLSHIDTVCLVGDPKQSIYAFRNADVYTYLAAAKAMGDSAKKHLDTNYRSTSALVSALNLLFAQGEGKWMPLPGGRETLEVVPVKSGAKLAEDNRPPIEFFIAIGERGRSHRFPTIEMLETQIFPYIASEILAVHSEKNVPLHEIAILVKDRYQAQALVDFLEKNGISSSFKRGASLLDSPAYFALKEILAAVCSPYDMSKIKAALGGALILCQADVLQKPGSDVELLQAKAKMQMLHQVLLQKGFGPFFQAFLATPWSSQPLLQDIFGRKDAELYRDLRKLAELLIEEETECGLKGEEFLLFLEELPFKAHQEENRLKVTPQEERGSVTVMTMHMSKGLEFDTVFALGLASRHKVAEHLLVKKTGRSFVKAYDMQDAACQGALEEQDAEKMRQFYVALTRAKKRLYIPLVLEEEPSALEIGEAAPVELFFARTSAPLASHPELYAVLECLTFDRIQTLLDPLAPHIYYRRLEKVSDFSLQRVKPSTPTLVPPPPLNLPRDQKQLFSFTALSKKEMQMESLKPDAHAALSSHTLPLGSQTGQILHLLFEKIFKRGLHHPLDENALDLLINKEIAFSPLEPYQSIFLPWILDLLKKPLADFSLSEVPQDQLQQEIEFLFPIAHGLMKGFADLFFEFKGKYYLLDWKSNYLGPSDADYTEEKIIQAMQHHDYFLQASIYAGALERFVKLFDNRPFSECFGGAIYYFIRGRASYHFFPEPFAESVHEPIRKL